MTPEQKMLDAHPVSKGQQIDLWVADGNVLSVKFAEDPCTSFTPSHENLRSINKMALALARAKKSVIYHAETQGADSEMLLQPLEGLTDSMIMLLQLAEAIIGELGGSSEATP